MAISVGMFTQQRVQLKVLKTLKLVNQLSRKRTLSVEDVEKCLQAETDSWSITPQSIQVKLCAGIGLRIIAKELSVGIATPTCSLQSKVPL